MPAFIHKIPRVKIKSLESTDAATKELVSHSFQVSAAAVGPKRQADLLMVF